MEEDTVTTVNEQPENLEESPEDSNQVADGAQNSPTSSDRAVDEDLQRAPNITEDGELNDETSSQTSTGNLVEE